jgi:hypothetical protein
VAFAAGAIAPFYACESVSFFAASDAEFASCGARTGEDRRARFVDELLGFAAREIVDGKRRSDQHANNTL